MRRAFSLTPMEEAVTVAVRAGITEAAQRLAEDLRESGERASVEMAPEGVGRVLLEGADAIAREFGTRRRAANPVLGSRLLASRSEIAGTIADAVARAVRGGR